MQKTVLLIGGVVVFMLSACSKSYTCACTDGTPNNIVYEEEIKAKNKTEAQEYCRSLGIECDCL